VDVLLALIGLVIQGLVIGALARLGGGVGYFLGAVILAALLITAYRRFVQRRGITGPGASEQPTRGFGLRRRS
jgi:hypothetical protein